MSEDRLIFRAWNGGEMVYFGEGSITTNYENHFGMFFPLQSKKFRMVVFKVMQYTGLKDKHSTKIYDGDIIGYGKNSDEGISVIVWDDEFARYISANRVEPPRNFSIPRDGVGEVIGNIHESPELLTTSLK